MNGHRRTSSCRLRAGLLAAAVLATGTLLLGGAAWVPPQASAESVFTGRITVSSEIDSSGDFGGFHVVVGTETEQGLDTLGHAVTDESGRFATTVDAPRRGIYSVLVSRNDQLLAMGDLAVSAGDSARMRLSFPHRGPWLSIRSAENASWLAFKNLRVQHAQRLSRLLSDSVDASLETVALQIRQSSDMMWTLRSTFPGTIGAEFGSAESVIMLEGWNDSLALARANQIPPENPRFADVGRVARRATARREGQAAALRTLERYTQRALTAEEKATLMAERVRAHLDSLEREAAVEAARELQSAYPESRWADWAGRAEYEANNLLPGMEAPAPSVRTLGGERVSLDSLRGRVVVVEFWAPQSTTYRRQLPQVNQLYEQLSDRDVAWLGVSLESDPGLDETFREGRTLPGMQVRTDSAQARRLVERFNVMSVPTRLVIGPDGRIVRKYTDQSIAALRADLLRRFEATPADTTEPPTP